MKNSKSFDEKILEKIENEKIKPEPKWKFMLKEYFIWGLAVLALLIGGVAGSILIYQARNSDFDVYRHLNGSFINFLIISIPYIWFILLAILIAAAIYNFKHTRRGYKYHPAYIIIGSILLSFFIGGILFKTGVGRFLDENFERNSLFYARFIGGRHKPWLFPERGFLGGMIISVESDNNFRIKDFVDREWLIEAEEALILEPTAIDINNNIRMLGEIIEKDVFRAKKIMPLGERRGLPPPPPGLPHCEQADQCPF